jgi:aryl-alcohol dehydrogenase-like predicted oxidoreductase
MIARTLGRTGLHVSAVGFGTVSLGVDYGIAAPGQFGKPPDNEAVSLLRAAFARGVTLYDTAPAYGESERLLGDALDARGVIATKVTIGVDVPASLERSRRLLRRDCLDVVQIHNATVEILRGGPLLDELERARAAGKLRFIGASVYTEAEALAAIESGRIDVLQVAFSLLDQRMAARVLPAAAAAGVGVLVRSAYLKGALTEKAPHLPEALAPLKEAIQTVRAKLGVDWGSLTATALRFCLSQPVVSSVLVGVRTAAELDAALTAAAEGPLSAAQLAETPALALDDERWINPAKWPVA